MNTPVRMAILVLAASLIATLPACRKAQDAAVEAAIEHASGQQVDVDQAGDTMTVKTEQGELKVATATDGGSIALPDGFPTDVHLPVQHKINSAMDMAGMKMVNLSTPVALAEVSADIEKSMSAQGWKREMAMQAGEGNTLVYSKDKRQAVYQMIKADDGGTQLAIRAGGG